MQKVLFIPEKDGRIPLDTAVPYSSRFSFGLFPYFSVSSMVVFMAAETA
jgi:hypothetical protein